MENIQDNSTEPTLNPTPEQTAETRQDETKQDETRQTEVQQNAEALAFESRLDLGPLAEKIAAIKHEIAKVIVGQHKTIDRLLVALLANGHILLEGVPGVAKTLTAKVLAQTIDTTYSRIQFTPDLMPSDILGTSVFNMQTSAFDFKKGPIFANLVLIDEINRAPAKTQAALFEVMEERQITIDNLQFKMDQPFLVIATQNPIEQEGTYRLPEAQLDRFLFKIEVEYPNLEEEINILAKEHALVDQPKTAQIERVITPSEIIAFQKLVKQIVVEDNVMEYIAKIVHHTRTNPLLYLGASPRASLAILNAAKGYAAINNRDFVTPEDIKEAAYPVLIHRVIVAPEREMEGVTAHDIIQQIVEAIDIPR
ncbi:MoxR family ATPase [Myroides sp. WP-1]|uniref:AAA family ATPase n=1 Tax=Myroides sp. WP-1 TaxID=2759944 RepID=UPI00210355F3|nr:MoxR family ATPase [Myroides sp. WP-1]